MGGLRDITIGKWVAAERIGGQEKFHAVSIAGRVAQAALHVAAADPGCAGSHANLVALAVIAQYRTHGVRAVLVVVEGRRCIRPGIVPVVVVVDLFRLADAPISMAQSRMLPIIAGILPGHNNPLAGETHVPNLIGVNLANVPAGTCFLSGGIAIAQIKI